MCCHCIVKFKDKAESPTETMDTIAKLKKIKKKIVPASLIHEVIKTEESDLESLAERELQKLLKRQARGQKLKRKISNDVSEEEDLQPKTSKDRRISDSRDDSESWTRATDSQEDMELGRPEVQPRLPRPVVNHLENTLQCYRQVQQDVMEPVELHVKLRDPEGIICARPKHAVSLKDSSTKGLIMVKFLQNQTLDEAVKEKKVQFLEESSGESRYQLKRHDKLYHQVQAWIYAGDAEGYTFCDFVTYLKVSKDISVLRISPDHEWQENIPKVRKYCKIFDRVVKRKLEQCKKSLNSPTHQ